jgi:hypothetical protein
MTSPLTPKPTRKAEVLVRTPPTIVSRRKEDVAMKEVAKPQLCSANDIFETKTKDGSTTAKDPAPRTNPNTKEAPTAPKPHTHRHSVDMAVGGKKKGIKNVSQNSEKFRSSKNPHTPLRFAVCKLPFYMVCHKSCNSVQKVN